MKLKQLSKLLRLDLLITSFTIIILISLFLGDGKQNVIDLFMALMTVSLFFVLQIKLTKQRSLPVIIHRLWMLVLGFYLLRSVFSDSVGYSVYATARMLVAYTLFYLFYVYSKRETVKQLANSLLTINVFAILISFGLLILPQWGMKLPAMNLLYAAYGHNYLASLIIVSFPLVVHRLLQNRSKTNLGLFLLFATSFLFSFARGALVVLIFYFLYLLIKHLKVKSFWPRAFAGLGLLSLISLLLSLFLLAVAFRQDQIPFLPSRISKQIVKSTKIEENRGGYWLQAWSAFRDQPLFGHGPGTFNLLSKRYQTKPASFSYHAHSFPLEILAETGLTGFILLSILIGSIFWLILKKYQIRFWSFRVLGIGGSKNLTQRIFNNYHLNKTGHCFTLLEGLILMFIYAFIDFSLNFYVVWLVFWTGLAVLIGNNTFNNRPLLFGHNGILNRFALSLPNVLQDLKSKVVFFLNRLTEAKNSHHKHPIFIYFTLIYLFIFYSLSIIGIIATSQKSLPWKNLALITTPYDHFFARDYLQNYAENLTPDSWQFKLINFFHRQDPDILASQNDLLLKTNQTELANQVIFKAINNDPQNLNLHQKYILQLLNQESYQNLNQELELLGLTFAPHELRLPIHALNLPVHIRPVYYQQNIITSLKNQIQPDYYLQKVYYLLGLNALATNPQLTRQLWDVARLIGPGWSYYHIELASIEAHYFNNLNLAHSVLQDCQQYPDAKYHCEIIEKDGIPPIGSLAHNIEAIPQILDE